MIHFPVDRVDVLLNRVSSALPKGLFPESWIGSDPERLDLARVEAGFVVPLLGFLFFTSVLVVSWPLVRSGIRGGFFRDFFVMLRTQRRTLATLFGLLCVLTIPFRRPYAVAGLGFFNAHMSLSPFSRTSEDLPWTYRRLLMPSLAHALHMTGPIYWFFSILCTFVLLALVVYFIDQRVRWIDQSRNQLTGAATVSGGIAKYGTTGRVRFLALLSLATSSFLMSNFTWPGYTEQLAYVLILFAACSQVTRLGRLAMLGLGLAAHEAAVFALIPIVIVCFPRPERVSAFSFMGLYFLMWMLSSGSSSQGAAEPLFAHQLIGSVGVPSVLEMLREHAGRAVLGVVFSYKLHWLVLVAAVILLARHKLPEARRLLWITLFPLVTVPIAWDTSRLLGLGFLGMAAATAFVLSTYSRDRAGKFLWPILAINILVPSYNILLPEPIDHQFAGFYHLIHSGIRWVGRSVAP